MTIEAEFETFKKEYILKTLLHLEALEKLQAADFQKKEMISELALGRAGSTASYMELVKIIRRLKPPEG